MSVARGSAQAAAGARDKPLTFFGGLGLACMAIALLLGLSTSVVPAQPTGVIAATLILLGALLISTGLVLHTLNFRVKELHPVITRRPGS